MLRFITGLAALLWSTAAVCSERDEWERREYAYHALNLVDAAQTCYVVGTGRGFEANPLYGRTPSCAKIVGIKIATSTLHHIIADELYKRDPDAAKLFQKISIGIQSGVVAWNFTVVF